MAECQNRITTNIRTAGGYGFGVGFWLERIMLKFRLLGLTILLLAWAMEVS